MAAIWVCPIDGCLPADNGTDQTKVNNVVNTTTGLDVNGNAAHCPICGSAAIVVNQTTVQNETGVAAVSQTPANVDTVYVTAADSTLAQQGTLTTRTGSSSVVPHAYKNTAGVVTRGTSTVTAETLNAVVGP